MRVLILSVFFTVLGIPVAAFSADTGDAILGTWLTDDGASKVQISAAQGGYRGHVVWLKEPFFPADDHERMAGQPKVDRHNPDPALRDRPIIGLAVLNGLHYADNNAWDGGTIYAPASGKSYLCKATLAPDGTLKLTVGGSLFGRTIRWTRTSPVTQAGSNLSGSP